MTQQLLVLGSDSYHVPGDIFTTAKDAKGSPHKISCLVVRDATFEEWYECYLALGGNPEIDWFPPYKHYYAVHAD